MVYFSNAIANASSTLSFHHLIKLLRSKTNQHIVLANRVLIGVLSRRELLCAWESYSNDCLHLIKNSNTESSHDIDDKEIDGRGWLRFPVSFQRFCATIQQLADNTVQRLQQDKQFNIDPIRKATDIVLSHLMPKVIAYETMPNELPTALLWSMTQQSTTNQALVQSKLTVLRYYLGNTIEREVSFALGSLPQLYYPVMQPKLISGQSWRPQLAFEQKNLNDRKNVESFVKSSNESKQELEQLTGISEAEELVMLCRWARCDVFGKDLGLIQRLMSIIDFGIQQMLRSLSRHHPHMTASDDCVSVTSESSVSRAVSDTIECNALLALTVLIDISLSCSVETKVFLVNTIAAASSSGNRRGSLLSSMEKLIKHPALFHEEGATGSTVELITLFYELLSHLVQELRPTEIVLERLWFFRPSSGGFESDLPTCLPLMRSLLRFSRAVFQSFLLHSPSSSVAESSQTTASTSQQLVAMTGEEVISQLVSTMSQLHNLLVISMSESSRHDLVQHEFQHLSIEIASFLIAEQSLLSQSLLKDLDSPLIEELEKMHLESITHVIQAHSCHTMQWWESVPSLNIQGDGSHNDTHHVLCSLMILLMSISPNVCFKLDELLVGRTNIDASVRLQQLHLKLLSSICPLNYHPVIGLIDGLHTERFEGSVVIEVNDTLLEVMASLMNQYQDELVNMGIQEAELAALNKRDHDKGDRLSMSRSSKARTLQYCLSTEHMFCFTALMNRLGYYHSTWNKLDSWDILCKDARLCRVSDGLLQWRRSQCLQQLLSIQLLRHLLCNCDGSESNKNIEGVLQIQSFLQYFQLNSSPLALRWIRFVLEELTMTTAATSMSISEQGILPMWVKEMVDKMFLSLVKLKDVTVDGRAGEKGKVHRDALLYFTSFDLLANQLPNLPLNPTWLCDLLLELTEVSHLLTWSTVMRQAIKYQSTSNSIWPTAPLLLTLCKLQLQLVNVYEEQSHEDRDESTVDEDLSDGSLLDEIAKNSLDITTTLLLPFSSITNCDLSATSKIAILSSIRQNFRNLILDFEKKSAPTLSNLGSGTSNHQKKTNKREQELLWAFGERVAVACLHSIVAFESQRFFMSLIFSPITPSTVKRRVLQEIEYLNLFSFVQDFFSFDACIEGPKHGMIYLYQLLPLRASPSLWDYGHEDYMLVQDVIHLFQSQEHFSSDGLIATNFGIYLTLLLVSMLMSSSDVTISSDQAVTKEMQVTQWGKKIMRLLFGSSLEEKSSDQLWVLATFASLSERTQSLNNCVDEISLQLINTLLGDIRYLRSNPSLLQQKVAHWHIRDANGELIGFGI